MKQCKHGRVVADGGGLICSVCLSEATAKLDRIREEVDAAIAYYTTKGMNVNSPPNSLSPSSARMLQRILDSE